jgi:hypothetical protein
MVDVRLGRDPLLLNHWPVRDDVPAKHVLVLPGVAPVSWVAILKPKDAGGDVGRNVLDVGRLDDFAVLPAEDLDRVVVITTARW